MTGYYKITITTGYGKKHEFEWDHGADDLSEWLFDVVDEARCNGCASAVITAPNGDDVPVGNAKAFGDELESAGYNMVKAVEQLDAEAYAAYRTAAQGLIRRIENTIRNYEKDAEN